MKKTILAIAVMISSFGAANVSAQRCGTPPPDCPRQECMRCCPQGQGRGHHHSGKPRFKREFPGGYCIDTSALYRDLNLTPQQKAQLHKYSEKRREACRKAADKFRKSRQKAAKSYDKELEKILTPSQLQQYRERASLKRSRRADDTRGKFRGNFRRPDTDRPDFCPYKEEGK